MPLLSRRAWLSRPSFWLAVGFTVLLAIFAPLTALERSEAALLAREGIDTTAIVIGHNITTSRRNGTTHHEYHLSLRFTTEGGARVEVRHEVSQDEYNHFAIGTPMPLRYAASDPTVTEREAGDTARSAMVAGSLALIVLGALIASVVALWRSIGAQTRAASGERARVRVVSHKRIGRRQNGPAQAEWLGAGRSGWTAGHKLAVLPAVGSDITVLIDPKTGRGWWEGDF